MERKYQPHDYPLIVRRLHGNFFIISPDFDFHFATPYVSADPYRWMTIKIQSAYVEIEKRLERLAHNGKPQPKPSHWKTILGQRTPSDIISLKEVARIMKLSVSTVRRMIDSGKLRTFKTIGGHRRVSLKDLENFLLDHPAVPTSAGDSSKLPTSVSRGFPN